MMMPSSLLIALFIVLKHLFLVETFVCKDKDSPSTTEEIIKLTYIDKAKIYRQYVKSDY